MSESIPCTAFQVLLLSQQGSLTEDPLQLTSIVMGLAATSYSVADSHVDLDQSRGEREVAPDFHCLLEEDGSNQAAFTASYSATAFFFFVCKISTLLLIFSHAASPVLWTLGWLGGEYVIFQSLLFFTDRIWPANVNARLGFASAARIWVWNTGLL